MRGGVSHRKPYRLPSEALAFYHGEPAAFAEDQVFKFSEEERRERAVDRRMEDESYRILNAVRDHDYVSIPAGRGVTKCVGEDESILLAEGSYVRARELCGNTFQVLAYWNGGHIAPSIAFAEDNGMAQCVRIVFSSGIEIVRTTNHPLLTFDGFTAASALKSGDMVAAPSKLPVTAGGQMPLDHLTMLAYMIGDGCTRASSPTFSQDNGVVLEDMRRITDGFGCCLKRAGKYDYCISPKSRFGQNKVKLFLEKHGLWPSLSYQKRVPEAVFCQNNAGVAHFINRLMACDGTVHCPDKSRRAIVIALTSVNRLLCVDIRRLLLRFGILSRVKKIKTSWTHNGAKKHGIAFQCAIHDATNIIKFADAISVFGKEKSVARCRALAMKRARRLDQATTGYGVWPQQSLDYILAWRDKHGYRDCDFRPMGIRKRAKKYGKTLTEKTIHRFDSRFYDEKISAFLTAGVVWDKVISVEPLPPQPTVAISVPGPQTFVCDHIEHNTFSLSLLIIWFVYTRQHARVMCTGPKFDQLKATLWMEVRKWLQRSAVRDELTWTGERLYHNDESILSFAQLLTAREKENIAGVHDEHVLWVVDEASNVERDLLMAIVGGMTDPESKIILCGNPTRTTGMFYDSFTRLVGKPWYSIRLSSEDCKRKNKVWFEEMQRYPRESDMYRVNVLGLPPVGNPKAIITLEDVSAARDRTVVPGNFLEMGVDPAAEGNDLTAIAIRQGDKLLEVRVFAKTKAHEVVGHTINMLREYRSKTGIMSRVRIKIDDTGYGGACRHYLALNKEDNIEVVPCLFGGKGTEEYKDYATVMWFGLRDDIGNVELPNDDMLVEELSGREFLYVGTNQYQAEQKRKYKDRLGRSPDRADAVVMCFAGGPKKIFARGDASEQSNVTGFGIDWSRRHLLDVNYRGVKLADVLHYAAVVTQQDLSVSVLCAIYDFIKNKLYLYGELYLEIPAPEQIAYKVKRLTKYGLFEDNRKPRLIGNDEMFRADGMRRPLGHMLRRHGLPVLPPVRYDHLGAIALGAQMYAQDRVIIHEDLHSAQGEINLWAIKAGKPEKGLGFCEGLLLILSEVKRQIRHHPKPPVRQDYPAIREKTQSKNKDYAWMSN